MEDALVQERLNLFGPNGGVLILVVMEDALVRLISLKFNASIFLVLILVVMEDALVLLAKGAFGSANSCLNPCCNGRCTRTAIVVDSQYGCSVVLILVVMEDALVLGESIDLRKAKLVLILVVMEDALVHDNTWDYYTVS